MNRFEYAIQVLKTAGVEVIHTEEYEHIGGMKAIQVFVGWDTNLTNLGEVIEEAGCIRLDTFVVPGPLDSEGEVSEGIIWVNLGDIVDRPAWMNWWSPEFGRKVDGLKGFKSWYKDWSAGNR